MIILMTVGLVHMMTVTLTIMLVKPTLRKGPVPDLCLIRQHLAQDLALVNWCLHVQVRRRRLPMPLVTNKQRIRVAFQGWRWMTRAILTESLATEVARLQKLMGKQATSIWTMKKEDLLEVARKELGYLPEYAEKFTVVVLKEKIRRNREQLSALTEDPQAQKPKGLGKMTLQELMNEHQLRNLPAPSKATRAQIIEIIEEDVEARKLMSQVHRDDPEEEWMDLGEGQNPNRRRPRGE